MRPQRIVSNLSVNVIIHLEVKLNYEKILENGFPLQKREFLNVNIPQIPKDQCKGVKITELGIRLYGKEN